MAPDGIAGAVDVVGLGSPPTLIEIVGEPGRVATVADFTGYGLGVHVADTSTGRAGYALADAARLFSDGAFVIRIEQTFPISEGPQAHHLSQRGHVAGKLVVTLP